MTLAVILLYCLACLGFMAALLNPGETTRRAARLSLLVCLAAHLSFEIALGWRLGGLPVATPPQAIGLLVLLALMVGSPLLWRSGTMALGAFALPAMAVICAFVLPQAGAAAPLKGARYWLILHTLGVLAGEAAWLLAASGALTYLVHERAILRAATGGLKLPPLELLDRIVAGLLVAAFAGLSLGLMLGGLWAFSAGVALKTIAPKIAGGGLSWLALAFSLHQRFALGWRGRRTALITLGGLALTFILTGLIWLAFPAAHGLRLLR